MARVKTEHHKTAELILESAQEHFLQKGFKGTSINDVADQAKINKSLIYHHFGGKENLWKAVKERILKKSAKSCLDEIDFKRPTLKEFLDAFVPFRFHLYAHHPELVRLMGWQRLESQRELLSGVTNKIFTELDEQIISLQKAGEIRDDLKPDIITYIITSTASNGFMDKADFLETKKGQDRYLKFIIESLTLILSPKL
ncbi:MAG: TetR/AcrR family transcriptional regulator [Candidatus Saccharimonadaceae bacterium]